MGELTEMVLDGTLCQECGMVVAHHLDPNKVSRKDISPGFTRACKSCTTEVENRENSEECPDCENGKLINASGGGVKCDNCSYWFCY